MRVAGRAGLVWAVCRRMGAAVPVEGTDPSDGMPIGAASIRGWRD